MDEKPTYRELERCVKKLERDAVERRRVEKRIMRLNLVLEAVRKINQLMIKEKDLNQLLQGLCDNLIENRGYHNAWTALFDVSGCLIATAEAGVGKAFLPMFENPKQNG